MYLLTKLNFIQNVIVKQTLLLTNNKMLPIARSAALQKIVTIKYTLKFKLIIFSYQIKDKAGINVKN